MKTIQHEKLVEKIKQAMEDSIITTAEYDDIMNIAQESRVLDRYERAVLREFNCMIADGTLRRVAELN